MSERMSFDEFAAAVKESIRDFLPAQFRDAQVELRENQKINERYHSMTVLAEGQTISPFVNLDDMFSKYQKTGDMTPIFEKIAEIVTSEPKGINMDLLENYEKAKENLFIRVSNVETNKELLETLPHETIGDLAVTCHVMMDQNHEGIGSTMVTDALLEKFGVSKEQLFADAMENSGRILSPTLEPMSAVMGRLMGFDGVDLAKPSFDHAVENFSFRDDNMFVLSNAMAVNGAAVMFYPEVMEQIGAKAGGDLFVIPSSVHEVLLVADDGAMNRNDLENIIRDINAHEVSPADRLSDSLYHYDSKEHRLERAVDFEQRKEMEHSQERTPEKTSIKDKLKSAEARVNEQTVRPKPAKEKAIE